MTYRPEFAQFDRALDEASAMCRDALPPTSIPEGDLYMLAQFASLGMAAALCTYFELGENKQNIAKAQSSYDKELVRLVREMRRHNGNAMGDGRTVLRNSAAVMLGILEDRYKKYSGRQE